MKNQDFEQIPFELKQPRKKSRKALLGIYAAIFVMSLLLIFSYISENRNRVNALYKKLNQKDQEFSKYRTETGKMVALQDAHMLELNKENMKLVETVNKFKTIQGQVRVETKTIIKEVKVPYSVEVVKYIDTHTNQTYIRVPLPFVKSDTFFSINGKVQADGVHIDSLNIPNELTITTGKIDGGFFKKDKYAIEIVSNNPNVDISKVNNTQFKPKITFYKKWWFGFGLGAMAILLL